MIKERNRRRILWDKRSKVEKKDIDDKERVYNDIYPPDIVPISRSRSPRFGPYFPKTFHATQEQPAKIGCSAKVLAFARTIDDSPFIITGLGVKTSVFIPLILVTPSLEVRFHHPFPPRKQSGGNCRQLFVHREAQPLGVSVELTRGRPRVAWTSKSHLDCGGRAMGMRYNRGG